MIAEALKRTTLLMRTHLVPETPNEELLLALAGTTVVISADDATMNCHGGQCAVTTAAMLMARSGHRVFLDVPDAPLIGQQPPLVGGTIHEALIDIGRDLIPGVGFIFGRPDGDADLAAVFGRGAPPRAAQTIRLAAAGWSATMRSDDLVTEWVESDNPMGAFAAGALAAGEAFKSAMRRLDHRAATDMFDSWYAPSTEASIELCPDGVPLVADLGEFDIISGGAITNSLLYVLLRIPGAKGHGRVLDDDRSALSNLNRNTLLRRSRLDDLKVDDLATYSTGLQLAGLDIRFGKDVAADPVLRPNVLVGVDHIASRWAVQRTQPEWLGVGATADFMAQASEHRPGNACAGCVHPYPNDPTADIPTVAFVSFWAGLLVAAEYLRMRAGVTTGKPVQRIFCALRPETWGTSIMPIAFSPTCPIGHLVAAAE